MLTAGKHQGELSVARTPGCDDLMPLGGYLCVEIAESPKRFAGSAPLSWVNVLALRVSLAVVSP